MFAGAAGHKDAVRAIAFDADDQRLASGNCHQTIRLWDVQIGEGLRVLRGHTGGFFTLLYWILKTDFAVDLREFPTSAHLSRSGCWCF